VSHRALLSASRRFPLEILGEIFVQCAHKSITEARVIPLRTSSVCKRWRQAAFSTPRLWYLLFVHQGLRDPEQMARHWIQRSGICPLDVHVMIDSINGLGMMDQTMATISANNARIRSFHADVHGDPKQNLLPYCQGSMPALEELIIIVHHSNDGTGSPHSLVFQSTRLKTIELHNIAILWDCHVSPLPQLKSITIFHERRGPGLSMAACLTLLQSSPSIERVSLTIDGMGDIPNTFTDNPVSLPRLFSLALSSSRWVDISRMLDFLDVPTLQTLSLRVPKMRASPWTSIYSLVSRSQPPISSLDIHGWLGPDGLPVADRVANVIGCLKAMPSLDRIRVYKSYFDNDILKALSAPISTSDPTSPWISPQLRCLELIGCNDFDGDSLRQLVGSRLPKPLETKTGAIREPTIPVPISKLRVHECAGFGPQHRKWVEAMADMGSDFGTCKH
jgi:hypothetical protein